MSLPTDYQNFIHKSRYARWDDVKSRRETWGETVARYIQFITEGKSLTSIEIETLRESILNMHVMPSMRALMVAGEAGRRDNIALYNCAYLAINRLESFDECMYILLNGTGVGFSVERQYICDLPAVPKILTLSPRTLVVEDSKLGWVLAFRELLAELFNGKIVNWDLSKIRPAGAKLKVFGGRASGPAPLDDLFRFTVQLVKNAKGRKLNSLEILDEICKIANCIVVGGVRRSALISLSNLSDQRIRTAKSGQWWAESPQRALANNSVCYTEKPDMSIFMTEWLALFFSKSGERGIFNREASRKQAARNGRRDSSYDFGTNPCSEIILRDQQFCNLSEVVVRENDTLDELIRKVELATMLGTLQATFTDFKHINKKWQENTEEERLLGVSLTGIMDHPILGGQTPSFPCGTILEDALTDMKNAAIRTNREWARRLGCNAATAITCVKPSGTVSQLTNSASGIHSRYSRFYIRTVRQDKKDPLTQMLINEGVPHETSLVDGNTIVFSFPCEAPKDCITRDDMTAIEQLQLWQTYQRFWCEHKPSITVYVRDYEWLEVGAWVYKHFDDISGVSFLPFDTGIYKQAPYQQITENEYTKLSMSFPTINWERLSEFELEDSTVGSQTLACTAGGCEI